MLPPRAGGPKDLHLNVRGIQMEVHLVHLGEDRHGGGGGVDPAAGLGLRHPLDPVDAALELQAAVCPLPFDREADLLDASQLGLVLAVHLHLPPAGVGVHGVHPEQGVGEEGCLFASHAGPDLHDHVLAVVGIPGQQEDLDLLLQGLDVPLGLGELLPGHLPQLRVAQQGLRLLQVRLPAFEMPVGGHQGLQLPLLPVEPGHQVRVAVGLRRAQLGLQVLIVQIDAL